MWLERWARKIAFIAFLCMSPISLSNRLKMVAALHSIYERTKNKQVHEIDFVGQPMKHSGVNRKSDDAKWLNDHCYNFLIA